MPVNKFTPGCQGCSGCDNLCGCAGAATTLYLTVPNVAGGPPPVAGTFTVTETVPSWASMFSTTSGFSTLKYYLATSPGVRSFVLAGVTNTWDIYYAIGCLATSATVPTLYVYEKKIAGPGTGSADIFDRYTWSQNTGGNTCSPLYWANGRGGAGTGTVFPGLILKDTP